MKLAQKVAVNYLRAKLNLIAVVSKKKAAKKAFDLFSRPFRKSKKKIPPVFEKAEKLSFKQDGYNIKGYRFNHPAPHRVLILHGFESSCRNFDRYINPLIRKGYEVLAFDAMAHGRSEGKNITLPDYIKTIELIQAHYGPVDRYMAHSFGGLALVLYLEKNAHEPTDKAVLIAPATETTTAIDSFFKFLDLNDGIKTEFNNLIVERSGVPPEFYSIKRALPNLKAALLWIHDDTDEITPLSDVKPIMDNKPEQVEFMITSGLGHRRIYRDNKVQKRVFDFL